MAELTPSKLGINSTGTFKVYYSAGQMATNGTYDNLYLYPEVAGLSGTITDQTTSGCTINITNTTAITQAQNVTCSFSVNNNITRPVVVDFPIRLHSKAAGFYPASSTVTVPNTGGTYEIELYESYSDIVSWNASLSTGDALATVSVLDSDSNYIKLQLSVSPNTEWTNNISGRIRIAFKRYGFPSDVLRYWDFTIAKSDAPSDLNLIVTPASANYDAATIVTNKFYLTTTKTEETISSFNVVCSQASNILNNTEDNSFILTLPENDTINDLSFDASVTAQTSGGYTIKATVPITQSKTYLTLPTTNYDISYSQSTLTINGLSSNNISASDIVFAIPEDAQSWISSPKFTYNDGNAIITFNVTENTSLSRRNTTIGISVVKDSSSIINLSINVNQAVKSDIAPIWKDYIWAEETLDDFIEYHLDDGGTTIYAGKAYKYPGADRVEFLLNSVTENYLSNGISFPTTLSTSVMPNYLKDFTLVTSTGNEKPIIFFNDWSYKDTDLTSGYFLSDPITGLIDPRQYVMASWLLPTGEGIVNRFFYRDGTQTATDVTLRSGINGYTFVENITNLQLGCGDYIVIAFVVSGTISQKQIKYTIDNTGKDYVLYYVNAAGGWDSLLIEGNVKKTDEFESESYIKRVLRPSTEFARNKYLNTITSSWTLYTGYLNDEQASKMYNLLESTQVYLHNLKDNTITPVLITDTNCEYKTYTNQGKNKFYYTINVESSQDNYRK